MASVFWELKVVCVKLRLACWPIPASRGGIPSLQPLAGKTVLTPNGCGLMALAHAMKADGVVKSRISRALAFKENSPSKNRTKSLTYQ